MSGNRPPCDARTLEAMATWIGLLRGVNVGGRTLPMATLRAVAEGLGWGDVATYVQSGNLVSSVGGRATPATESRLAGELHDALLAETGMEIGVVLRSTAAWAGVVASNPYAEAAAADPTKVHVTFLVRPPTPGPELEAVDALLAPHRFGADSAERFGREVYLSLPDGMGRSKLAESAEKTWQQAARAATKAGEPAQVATTRNWRTVLELGRLAGLDV